MALIGRFTTGRLYAVPFRIHDLEQSACWLAALPYFYYAAIARLRLQNEVPLPNSLAIHSCWVVKVLIKAVTIRPESEFVLWRGPDRCTVLYRSRSRCRLYDVAERAYYTVRCTLSISLVLYAPFSAKFQFNVNKQSPVAFNRTVVWGLAYNNVVHLVKSVMDLRNFIYFRESTPLKENNVHIILLFQYMKY